MPWAKIGASIPSGCTHPSSHLLLHLLHISRSLPYCALKCSIKLWDVAYGNYGKDVAYIHCRHRRYMSVLCKLGVYVIKSFLYIPLCLWQWLLHAVFHRHYMGTLGYSMYIALHRHIFVLTLLYRIGINLCKVYICGFRVFK